MSAPSNVDRLISVVVRPAGWALVLPRAAVEVAAGAVATVRTAQEVLGSAAQVLPSLARLTGRTELLLDHLEPTARRVASQLEEPLLDDLLRAARLVPGLVLSLQQSLVGFEVFLARADGVRDAAAGVTARAGELNTEVAVLVRTVSTLVATAEGTVASAARTAARADLVATEAEVAAARAAAVVAGAETVVQGAAGVLDGARHLVPGVAGVVDVAAGTAAQAQRIADTVEELTRAAAPVAALSIELAERLADPARILTDATVEVAPVVADLAPNLVAVLAELTERIPDLLASLDTQVLPTLRELRRTPHDVRALKDSVEGIEPKLGDMEAELAGLPGAKLLRRRGRRVDAEDGPAPLRRSAAAGGPAIAQPAEDEDTLPPAAPS